MLRVSSEALRLYFQPLMMIDAALRERPAQRRRYDDLDPVPEDSAAGRAGTGVVDAEDKEQLTERLRRLATSDALTGLANRRAMHESISSLIREREFAAATPPAFAVVVLDLDNFKPVNDTHGHQIGDAVLQTVAERAKAWLTNGSMGRLGGDEFVGIVPEMLSRDTLEARAKELLDAIAKPISIAGVGDIRVTASAGLAVWPRDGADAESLLRAADQAMYLAKTSGRNAVRFHEVPSVSKRDSIVEAFEGGQLIAHYEAQLDLASNEIVAMEASLRWPSEEVVAKQPPSQSSLWARVDRAGLTKEVGSWFLETTCRQIETFQSKYRADFRLIVRISNTQFADPTLCEVIERALTKVGLEAHYLEILLEEEDLRPTDAYAVSVLMHLSEIGVKVAVSNFNPELWRTTQLPAISSTRIGLDITKNIAVDMKARELARAMTGLSHRGAARVVAVGVKDLLQLEVLHKIGCDAVQGPILGVPAQADDFAAVLANYGSVMRHPGKSNVTSIYERRMKV